MRESNLICDSFTQVSDKYEIADYGVMCGHHFICLKVMCVFIWKDSYYLHVKAFQAFNVRLTQCEEFVRV